MYRIVHHNRSLSPRLLVRWLALVSLVTAAALVATPAMATHLICGQLVFNDVKLDSDLMDCPVDGLVVGAPGITIDLAGHTIDGSGPANVGRGIRNSGHDGVTVRNGTIQQFGTGIAHFGADHTVTTGITSDNQFGIGLDNSDFGLIEKSSLFNSLDPQGGHGITLQFGSDDNVIEKNDAFDNTLNGILLLTNCDRNRISKNTTIGNNRQGISLFGGADGNLVEKNDSFGNTLNGIVVTASLDNHIEKNTLTDNGSFGIFLDNGDATPIMKNLSLRNALGGIELNSTSDGNLIEKNDAHENGDDGIDTDNPSTTITKNTANDNVDLGIEANSGAIDGGGNKARGNGNPAQCTGVSCK
jgi:parallel beta-helix repeat protein